MRYIDHIRNMSDDQLAYFLNAIQPEITLWSLSMMRALSRKPYKGVDALNGTSGDTRTLMSILYKDYDYEMKLMDEERNQSLDDLHDYASGNDLKRALGHPELQKERELPKAPYKAESEIHCNCTDAEIAKSFIEDVEAVKELLPQAESEDKK